MTWQVVQLLVAIGAAVVVTYGFNVKNRWQLRAVPGPSPSWMLGNIRELGSTQGMHLALEKWYRKYGPVYKFFLGRSPTVVVTDPQLLQQVCTKSFMKFHDRPQLQMRINEGDDSGQGMLSARGKYWAGIRAACEPVFHSDKLQTYVPIVNRAMGSLVDKLTAAEAQGPVQINLVLASMTMDVIGGSAFGVDFRAQEDSSSKLVQHSLNVFRPPSGASFGLVRIILVCFPFLISVMSWALAFSRIPRVLVIVGARGFFKGASEALLKNARQSRKAGSSVAELSPQPEDEGVSSKGLAGGWFSTPAHQTYVQAYADGRKEYQHQVPKDQTLLHNLVAAKHKDTGEPLTDSQICAQSFTFILAGYETTSMALTYALYELASNPQVQQRVVEEVDQFGREREPTFADLAHFPFVDAVFKEGMRLHPPVTPLIALNREAREVVTLGQYHIPAGTRIWINVRSLHLDDANFPKAKEFIPERFLEGSSGQLSHHPYAYLPFGAGPRKCIGYRFATMEGVLALVRLYQRFTFSLNKEKHAGKPLEYESLITLMPKGGVWLDVHRR